MQIQVCAFAISRKHFVNSQVNMNTDARSLYWKTICCSWH